MPKVKSLDRHHDKRVRASACIARYMTLRGITEEYLAKRFDVDIKTIRNRNRDPGTMRLSTLYELADVLKCPISELCGGELPEERLESVLKLIGSK